MGGFAWSPTVTVIEGRQPGTNRAMRDAVYKALMQEMSWTLGKWTDAFQELFTWDGMSIISIQREEELSDAATSLDFWFYLGEAPTELALHWLELLVAVRRPALEEALAKVGFEVTDEWPVATALPSSHRFFEYDGKIGSIDEGTITWSLPTMESGGDATELPADLRARLAAGDCMCGPCADLIQPIPPCVNGATMQRIFAASASKTWMNRRAGLFVETTGLQPDWVARRTKRGFIAVPELRAPKRHLTLMHETDSALVAISGYGSPKPPKSSAVSTDNGVTWTRLSPTGLPPLRYPSAFYTDASLDTIWMVPSSPKQLFRSDDGGRTFGPGIPAAFATPKVTKLRDIMTFGDRVIAEVDAKGGIFIEYSDDGGTSWTVFPQFKNAITYGLTSGQLAVMLFEDIKVTMWCTSDGGRSWSEPRVLPPGSYNFGARWYRTDRSSGGHTSISDDDGETWTKIIESNELRIEPDTADPRRAYAVNGHTIYQLIGPPLPRSKKATVFPPSASVTFPPIAAPAKPAAKKKPLAKKQPTVKEKQTAVKQKKKPAVKKTKQPARRKSARTR